MSEPTLLPITAGVRVDKIAPGTSTLHIYMTTNALGACCPLCAQRSERVHSHYPRTLTDVPWNRVAVRIHLRTRKFFCDNLACNRRVFTEPLPELAARYARKTRRFQQVLYLLGYALGGEAGARMAVELGLSVSPDTLLERVRKVAASTPVKAETLRAVGVDDWAFRKGRRYGTILVDLKRRRVVDLLPEATSESLATWLKAHPGIEIISRDRAGVYAEGARQGAPQAQQVADRWHLGKNLAEAVERCLEPYRTHLRDAAPLLREEKEAVWPPTKGKAYEAHRQECRTQRQKRYQEVVALYEQGMTKRQIALKLGLARATVIRYLHHGEFPEIARHKARPTSLDPYKPSLLKRWQEGCNNGSQLYRELQEQGFSGVKSWVLRYITGLRKAEANAPPPKAPASRTVACLFLSRPARLTQKQQAFLADVGTRCPLLKTVYDLAQPFVGLLRERQSAKVSVWMEAASHSGADALSRFAASLKQDLAAVEAGLSLPWSNGQTEGQVNRLKLVKRSMYGRANIDLLKARVLPMAQAA
jgi:transposase